MIHSVTNFAGTAFNALRILISNPLHTVATGLFLATVNSSPTLEKCDPYFWQITHQTCILRGPKHDSVQYIPYGGDGWEGCMQESLDRFQSDAAEPEYDPATMAALMLAEARWMEDQGFFRRAVHKYEDASQVYATFDPGELKDSVTKERFQTFINDQICLAYLKGLTFGNKKERNTAEYALLIQANGFSLSGPDLLDQGCSSLENGQCDQVRELLALLQTLTKEGRLALLEKETSEFAKLAALVNLSSPT